MRTLAIGPPKPLQCFQFNLFNCLPVAPFLDQPSLEQGKLRFSACAVITIALEPNRGCPIGLPLILGPVAVRVVTGF